MTPIPINELLATAQITQLIFIGLLSLGFFILFWASDLKHNAGLLGVLFLIAIATLVLSGITHEVSSHSQPAFRLPESRAISGMTAVKWGLSLDLAFAYAFVALTGGAVISSFSPLLFLLPTLALLLLRQESEFLLYYFAAASVAFLLAMFRYPNHYFEVVESTSSGRDWVPATGLKKANTFAYVVITLLCFWLSFYIAVQTQ